MAWQASIVCRVRCFVGRPWHLLAEGADPLEARADFLRCEADRLLRGWGKDEAACSREMGKGRSSLVCHNEIQGASRALCNLRKLGKH